MQFKQTFTFGSHAVEIDLDCDKLPQASREFGLAYGIRQYLSDAAALPEATLPKKYAGRDRDDVKAERVRDRLAKLVSGDVREGPAKLDLAGRERKLVIASQFAAYLAANKAVMPTDPALAMSVQAKFYAVHRDRIESLVAQRVAALTETFEAADDAADEILAMLKPAPGPESAPAAELIKATEESLDRATRRTARR